MPTVAFLWLVGAVGLNVAGWLLAALHQLNPAGCAVALTPGILLALRWLKKNPPVFRPWSLYRRCRRPLPAVFLLVTGLVLLGGVWYAPSNFDALTYRLPRLLHWLAAGTWFWIPTINERMNCANTAWEWTALPLLALTRSDRALFVINALGFVLLPGLLFSIFRQLGVARRVAWTWMWVLPLAYGYALQAGGLGNDLFGAVCCLLSLYFGLRARRTLSAADAWAALLAAALMTGVKVSNAPLALPCLVAVGPALGSLKKNRVGSLAVVALAIVVSAAPTALLNWQHTGSWTGDPQNQSQMQVKSPAAALLGNGLLVAEQSFMPPVLPGARAADKWINRHLPGALAGRLEQDFPRYRLQQLNELPGEEAAGLGLGCTGLILAGLLATPFARRAPKILRFPWLPAVVWAAGIAGLAFGLKLGSEASARLLLPYYPLLLVPFLLLPGQRALLRLRAGRGLALLAALSVLPALVLSPARPLWPARAVCGRLAAAHPGHPALERMQTVYATYAQRNDVLAPLREKLPDEVREIGFLAGGNDTDYSLWRPFGTRRVVDLHLGLEHFLQAPGSVVAWAVVKENVWPGISPEPLDQWAATHHARVVAVVSITTLVSWGPENWWLLRLDRQP